MILVTNNEGTLGAPTTARMLAEGAGGLDAIEAGIRSIEADPSVRTVGRGGWTVRTLARSVTKMLNRAGYKDVADKTDLEKVQAVLPQVDSTARILFGARRNTVKHNRGTDVFEAGNIRFGLEMRRLPIGDGGLAIHVLGDVGGGTRKSYAAGRASPIRKKPSCWRSTASGTALITTMARATRTTASTGT